MMLGSACSGECCLCARGRGTPFYADRNLEETVDLLEKSGTAFLVVFWIFWVALIGGACYGFCYFDNRWLT